MRRVLRSLDLFPPLPEEPRPASRQAEALPRLWLAVCLPNLPFEASPGAFAEGAAVVVEPRDGQLYVVATNAGARRAGIEPGAKLNTALALAASLQVFEREPHCESAALESLAEWAETLTSLVSIEPPDGLLLEVLGSLKLFGSLEAIKARLRGELERRGGTFQLCMAPTATAALWLARSASADVVEWRELPGRLGSLPLRVTRWPLAVQALLRDLGVRTIGECARLPRDGLARRAGVAVLHELDRAFGRSFDIRAEFAAPRSWRARVDLGPESADCALLLAAVEHLLDGLVAELCRRQSQISRLELAFEHWRRPPTLESFDLLEPTHEHDRLLRLVRDRLERTALPVPAVAIGASSGAFAPLVLAEPDLFEAAPLDVLTQTLFERLQGRLGATAVHGVRVVAEHRPEKAWARAGARQRVARSNLPSRAEHDRPLWLLPQPVPLSSSAARSHYRGSLEVCAGPERIESGWWDEHDVGRDYYTVVSSHGQRLWVFRDRSNRSWLLHGLFG
jgi:protein ImuB